MYILTDDQLSGVAPTLSHDRDGPTYTRELYSSKTGSPSSNAPIANETWYQQSWVVPATWALAFYCVLSMLMLCTLYGQGLLDRKLNVSA